MSFRIAPLARLRALLRLPQHVQARSLVENERAHQIDLGFDAAHDAQHTAGDLQDAALAYLFAGQGLEKRAQIAWPWPTDEVPFKPSSDPFENLVKATALLHAEITRILLNHPLNSLAIESRQRADSAAALSAAVRAAACRSSDLPEELPSNPDQAHPPRRAA